MKALFDRLRWLFPPRDKKKFLLLAALMAVSALLEMAGIGLLLGAAALFLSPESAVALRLRELLAGILPGNSAELQLAALIGVFALLLAGKNLFALGIVRLQSRFIAAKQSELARRLFDAYLHGDSETMSALPPEECFGNITRINRLCHQLLLPGLQVAADVLVIGVLCLTSLLLFPRITLGGAIFMLAAAGLVSRLTRKWNRRTGQRFLEREIAENHIRHAGIFGAQTIKCTGAEAFFSREFSARYGKYADAYGQLYTLGQIPRFALESASVIAVAGVFCILLLGGVPQTEIMVIFAVLTAAVARLLPAISRCHYNLTIIRQSMPFLSLIDLLRTIPQEPETAVGPAADAGRTIAVNSIDFAYRNGTEVFRNFSLELPPLSSTALAGRSGRGKTTLVELLLALLRPQRGTITAGGVDIANDPAAWRRQIGFVPQNIFILDGSLRENIAFGIAPEQVDDAKIAAAMELAQLTGLSPDQHVTANNLSGGQKQRVGIARALYREVKLLILDEATSALDADTERAFCDALAALRGRLTMLVISHRESTLARCDRIIEI